ncbi:hypothetical protein Y032_0087g2111 [Ancylostoma ceylanicum]|nr:hypothetical protein Y032_0087g2111 [Ancylostoma ceylanicum]
MTMGQMAVKLYKSDGVLSFYNGISASLLRQLTYSTTRFGMYETLKKQFPSDQPLPFYQKALLAGFSGACGGFVGTPGDLVNVRMQNDVKQHCSRTSASQHHNLQKLLQEDLLDKKN